MEAVFGCCLIPRLFGTAEIAGMASLCAFVLLKKKKKYVMLFVNDVS